MKFFDLFPTPRYLSVAQAGVSISSSELRYLSFRHGHPGELIVNKFGAQNLPEGAIVGGAVGDKQGLAMALAKLKAEGFKYISLSIPEEKAYLFTTSVDRVPYKDLRDAVSFTVEENVPVTLAESTIAFETLVEADKIKAAVTALPLEVSRAYIEAFESAGITIVSIDTDPEAIARALVAKGDERAHLIINLGDRQAGFYIVDDEVVQFSSTVAFNPESPDGVQSLRAEIRKFFVFWDTRLDGTGGPGQKIEHVIICGRRASDDALVSNLMSEVETPYTLGNVWINVAPIENHMPEMPFAESLSYAAAIGAAMPKSKHLYV